MHTALTVKKESDYKNTGGKFSDTERGQFVTFNELFPLRMLYPFQFTYVFS